MNTPISADKFWDRNANKYVKSKIGDPAAYEHTLARSQSYMKDTDHVLELGCGSGMTALKFAPFVAEFTAADLSAEMIAHCQRRAEAEAEETTNVRFVQAAVGDDKLGNQQFDIVMAHSLLHLLPELDADLHWIYERVKPGGLFISKSVCIGEVGALKRGLMKLAIRGMRLVGKAPFVNLINIADLEKAVVSQDFEILESGNFPDKTPPARYLVACKW